MSLQIPLLTHNRLDLAIKISFLESMELSDTEFDERFYDEHIRAFSLGRYDEPGNDDKLGAQAFKRDFVRLAEMIRSERFDPTVSLVPVAADGSILDGAHRTACSIFFQKPIWTVQTGLSPKHFDHEFFRARGMSEGHLDAAAAKFVEYGAGCHLALIWPVARHRLDSILTMFTRVVGIKSVMLNGTGAHNLISQVYPSESWLGPRQDDYPGVAVKQNHCFLPKTPLTVVAFQADALDEVAELKRRIRGMCHLDKHALHITDSPTEAVRVARLLFNDTSLQFLNSAFPNKFLSAFDNVTRLKKAMDERAITDSRYIVDGGSVLAAFGLRESEDVDYLSLQPTVRRELEFFDDHSGQLKFHGVSAAELIRNPSLHFHYWDTRFVGIQQLRSMKARRGSPKDQRDIALLQQVASGGLQLSNVFVRARFLKNRIVPVARNRAKTLALAVGDGLGIGTELRGLMSRIMGRPVA